MRDVLQQNAPKPHQEVQLKKLIFPFVSPLIRTKHIEKPQTHTNKHSKQNPVQHNSKTSQKKKHTPLRSLRFLRVNDLLGKSEALQVMVGATRWLRPLDQGNHPPKNSPRFPGFRPVIPKWRTPNGTPAGEWCFFVGGSV